MFYHHRQTGAPTYDFRKGCLKTLLHVFGVLIYYKSSEARGHCLLVFASPVGFTTVSILQQVHNRWDDAKRRHYIDIYYLTSH